MEKGNASKYLTADDLLPLLQFLANTVSDEYGDSPCCLETLYLDGNRLKDESCKVIAKSLSTNRRLKRLSMEHNKCSFKGFLRIMDSIVAAVEAFPYSIKLCALPMASILDDLSGRSKVKKHRQQIERCTFIIQRNVEQRQMEQKEAERQKNVKSMDSAPDDHKQNDDDHREEGKCRSPGDELAFILNSAKLRTVKPIEDTFCGESLDRCI